MTNTRRGAVYFPTEDGDRYLRFSTNAVVLYQDRTGETLNAALIAMQNATDDIRRIRALFWAGLSHEEGMTMEQAGDLIDEVGLSNAARMIGEAVTLAFPASSSDEGEASGNGRAGKKRAPATS